MYQSVLQPVERRRRRRRRRLRPLLLGLLLAGVLAATAIGAVDASLRNRALFRDGKKPVHRAAVQPKPPAAAATPVRRPAPRPLRLLLPALPPPHTFSRPLHTPEAILVDAATGRVLYARRPHQQRPIASTTKIMTAVLAIELLDPAHQVRIPWYVPRTAPFREGLRRGERVPVWKLLYGLMLFSGNDDAVALAAATGGKAHFIRLMNDKARQLGLRNTRFTTPSGVLDRGNHSSAWDLAALARYAMESPRFRTLAATRTKHVPWSAPTFEKVYVNKNHLLGHYRGADGVKTGWTTLAGHCLVASAHRGGRRLIAVVLHSTDPYGDARRLLNFGFETSS
jgi:D-alanyl-D-alanine carboxypeptidase